MKLNLRERNREEKGRKKIEAGICEKRRRKEKEAESRMKKRERAAFCQPKPVGER